MLKILFEPFNSTSYYQGKLFEISKPFKELKKILEKKGFEPRTVDQVSFGEPSIEKVIFFNLDITNPYFKEAAKRFSKEKMVLVLFEPPVVIPKQYQMENHKYFSKVLTWNDDLIDNKRYFKFFWMNTLNESNFSQPKFSERKLATLMNARKSSNQSNELYSERVKAIEFFEKNYPNDFDLYGYFWNQVLPQDPPGFKLPPRPSYRGSVENKYQTLAKYKFNICYENMGNVKGYITEKIFDAFLSRSVPVYLGASNITEYIPEDAFIDRRRFNSYDELYQFLKGMNLDTHERYIKAGKRFLQSQEGKKWFDRNWAEDFINRILG